MDRRKFLKGVVAVPVATSFPSSDFQLSRMAVTRTPVNIPAKSVVTGNALSTIDQVTREALRIAHEKLHFTVDTNRTSEEGAVRQIGDTLKIRRPARYSNG